MAGFRLTEEAVTLLLTAAAALCVWTALTWSSSDHTAPPVCCSAAEVCVCHCITY
jgi:hypothetical protein